MESNVKENRKEQLSGRESGSKSGSNKGKKSGNRKPRRQQPKKDSKDPRVNYDNTRESKFIKDTDNDVTWYAKSPQMLLAAASLPAFNVVGQELPWNNQTIPGAMAMYWDPAYGGTNIDAINQSANSMYSYVVHANSRNQSYDPNDLFMLVSAGMHVFSTVAHLVRAYGVAKMYNELNNYMPDGLLKLMGFKPDDVRANLSRMWFDINELIARSSQIWIPNVMPVMVRQFWMNTNVYMDSNSPKAQMYFYSPNKLYAYNATAYSDGGSLLAIVDPSDETKLFTTREEHSWEDWMKVMNAMFEPLLMDQDRGIIFGDILKAYGLDKLFSMTPISVDYRTPITYSPEVLMQMENATIANTVETVGLKQDMTTNTLTTLYADVPGRSPSEAYRPYGRNGILNFHSETPPSAGDIMVATRVRPAAEIAQNVALVTGKNTAAKPVWEWTLKSPSVQWLPAATGTETIFQMRYIKRDNAANVNPNPITIYNYDCKMAYTTGSVNYSSDQVLAYLAFDWAPWIYECASKSPTTNDLGKYGPEIHNALGDYDMFIVVDAEELVKMHTAAVYSEYGVPHI